MLRSSGKGRCTVIGVAMLVVLLSACHRAAPPPDEVRLAYPTGIVTLDPHAHDDAVTRSLLFAVYEPLVTLSPDLEVEPDLAERWDTPDSTTWRFTLRHGVRFHDGRELTVKDVVGSLRRACWDEDSAVASYLTAVADVRQAEGTSDVVEVITKAAFPLLLTRLAMAPIVPYGRSPSLPLGTGPYVWRAGTVDGPVLLERWHGYWGAPPAVERVRVLFVGAEDTISAIREGGLDIIARASIDFVRSHHLGGEWQVVRAPSLATTLLGLNVQHWPLSDPRVREAIDAAIDRRELVQAAYADGDAEPAVSVIPAEVFGFSPTGRLSAADPERARRLLNEAGVGADVELALDHAGVPQQALDFVAASLARVGLRVRPVAYPWDTFYRRLMAGDGDIALFGWNFPFADASDFLDGVVHTREAKRRFGLQNGTGYSNVQVDRWLEEAATEPRSSRRLELLRKALTRVALDRPYLPLYHRVRLSLVRRPFTLQARGGAWVLPQDIGIELADRD